MLGSEGCDVEIIFVVTAAGRGDSGDGDTTNVVIVVGGAANIGGVPCGDAATMGDTIVVVCGTSPVRDSGLVT